ncbi:hypothetical protein PTTG_05865 [Puccinia triticina 1-1 BBBD Race 1]|uniref:Uncharacterized protein n=2 Tax=Puccinia triticina TaxID=208348 RepID=A0A0C4EYG5_PUCT1|nr:uncharacterized protein PtA15_18A39 [Puccinia triticina]OAV92481.1 hypothetical protein PTTG_05865 [Puccinia triticina 1-1 BBBD Race 1]WAQ92984.1 hypothetical protein PtA15_18A39 [Puccinia triticina]WAR62964.1 hypothetical protein PtB15_18B46 [Puccinia triticina]
MLSSAPRQFYVLLFTSHVLLLAFAPLFTLGLPLGSSLSSITDFLNSWLGINGGQSPNEIGLLPCIPKGTHNSPPKTTSWNNKHTKGNTVISESGSTSYSSSSYSSSDPPSKDGSSSSNGSGGSADAMGSMDTLLNSSGLNDITGTPNSSVLDGDASTDTNSGEGSMTDLDSDLGGSEVNSGLGTSGSGSSEASSLGNSTTGNDETFGGHGAESKNPDSNSSPDTMAGSELGSTTDSGIGSKGSGQPTLGSSTHSESNNPGGGGTEDHKTAGTGGGGGSHDRGSKTGTGSGDSTALGKPGPGNSGSGDKPGPGPGGSGNGGDTNTDTDSEPEEDCDGDD